ncbi:MAG: DNA gyrase inhibitor YacG [Acidobacteria bacterium]|nr:DNA gyrase inhibitor YacG [Acidobacteriota bacterium]
MPEAPICPYCRRRPAEPGWLPFCSERCKMADLGRWLSGDYRVPGAPIDEVSLDGESAADDESTY